MKPLVLTAVAGLLLVGLLGELPAADPARVIELEHGSGGLVFGGIGGFNA